ncbi:hypothetical protein Gpo141_00009573, partial [Globisporangium polare]
RVIGTKNIFVADASAMRDGTVNPYGFIMYTGRETAGQVKDFVLNGAAQVSANCSIIDEGVEYVGGDIGDAYSAKAEGCCSLCSSFSGCNAFTWSNYNDGTCWFKSGKGATKLDATLRSSVINNATPVPASACAAVDENADYSGPDVGNTPSTTAEGCCAICAAKSGCGAYTWTNYSGGTCWLKSYRGTKKQSAGVRSAVLNSAPKCNLENDVDFTGNDIANASSATATACCDVCRGHSDCKAFTWTSYNGGTCWLKSAGEGAKTNVGSVSGTI